MSLDPYRHTFEQVKSPDALVCKKEINGPQGGAEVFHVMLADGFLLECGRGPDGEARANILAVMINRGDPALLSHAGLRSRIPTR